MMIVGRRPGSAACPVCWPPLTGGPGMSKEITKITRREALQSALLLGAYSAGGSRLAFGDAPAASNKLWYRQPAETWTEALPIGNGRIGAMIYGGVARDRL